MELFFVPVTKSDGEGKSNSPSLEFWCFAYAVVIFLSKGGAILTYEGLSLLKRYDYQIPSI